MREANSALVRLERENEGEPLAMRRERYGPDRGEVVPVQVVPVQLVRAIPVTPPERGEFPVRSVLGVRPYQSGLPAGEAGPCQVALATVAAARVMGRVVLVVAQAMGVPTRTKGLKVERQAAGSEMIPSRTPSRESHAEMAAAVRASSSQG